MKIKKTLSAISIGIFLLLGMTSGTAFAAATCDQTTIQGIGMYPALATADASMYRIWLSCGDAAPDWPGTRTFLLSKSLGDAGYATILTAKSLGKTLFVYAGGTATNSLIFNIYMNP